jgi:hypothetical protein
MSANLHKSLCCEVACVPWWMKHLPASHHLVFGEDFDKNALDCINTNADLIPLGLAVQKVLLLLFMIAPLHLIVNVVKYDYNHMTFQVVVFNYVFNHYYSKGDSRRSTNRPLCISKLNVLLFSFQLYCTNISFIARISI